MVKKEFDDKIDFQDNHLLNQENEFDEQKISSYDAKSCLLKNQQLSHQSTLSSYVPAIFGNQISQKEGQNTASKDIKKYVLEELKNIAKFENTYSQVKWLFAGYESIKNRQIAIYLTDSWKNDVFQLMFNLYKSSVETIVRAINQQLNANYHQEKNGPNWKVKFYVENKAKGYLRDFHSNKNLTINVNGEQVTISVKRLIFEDWESPKNIKKDDKATLWYSYLSKSQRFKINVNLKGKKDDDDDDDDKDDKDKNDDKNKHNNRPDVKDVGSNIIKNLGGFLSGLFKALWGAIAGIFAKAWEWFKSLFERKESKVEKCMKETEQDNGTIPDHCKDVIFEGEDPKEGIESYVLEKISKLIDEELNKLIEKYLNEIVVEFKSIDQYKLVIPKLENKINLPNNGELIELPTLNLKETNDVATIAHEIEKKIANKLKLFVNKYISLSKVEDNETVKNIWQLMIKCWSETGKELSRKNTWKLESLTKESYDKLNNDILKTINFQIVYLFEKENNKNSQKFIEEIIPYLEIESYFAKKCRAFSELEYKLFIDKTAYYICKKIEENLLLIDENEAEFRKQVEYFEKKFKEMKSSPNPEQENSQEQEINQDFNQIIVQDFQQTIQEEIKATNKLQTEKDAKRQQMISQAVEAIMKYQIKEFITNNIIHKRLEPKLVPKYSQKWAPKFAENLHDNLETTKNEISKQGFKNELATLIWKMLSFDIYKLIQQVVPVKSRDFFYQIVVVRLKEAIIKQEKEDYKWVKNSNYGLFDKDYQTFYFLPKMKMSVYFQVLNEKFKSTNFLILKNYLQTKLSNIEILAKWYQKLVGNEKNLKLKIKTILLDLLDEKYIEIQGQKTYINQQKINIDKIELISPKTLSINLGYQDFISQTANIRVNLI